MKYQTRLVTIEAVRWTGDNRKEIESFVNDGSAHFTVEGRLFIKTLEGNMEACISDQIICGLKGEFYPCKSDVFDLKYEVQLNG